MSTSVTSPDGATTIKVDQRKHSVQPWIYVQATGELFDYKTGEFLDRGYSGRGTGLNRTDSEHLKGIGPVPRGLYMIGRPRTSERTGRFVLDLSPLGHVAMGRSGFQIHGDNKSGDMTASQGCIVLPLKTRSTIAAGSPLIVVI